MNFGMRYMAVALLAFLAAPAIFATYAKGLAVLFAALYGLATMLGARDDKRERAAQLLVLSVGIALVAPWVEAVRTTLLKREHAPFAVAGGLALLGLLTLPAVSRMMSTRPDKAPRRTATPRRARIVEKPQDARERVTNGDDLGLLP